MPSGIAAPLTPGLASLIELPVQIRDVGPNPYALQPPTSSAGWLASFTSAGGSQPNQQLVAGSTNGLVLYDLTMEYVWVGAGGPWDFGGVIAAGAVILARFRADAPSQGQVVALPTRSYGGMPLPNGQPIVLTFVGPVPAGVTWAAAGHVTYTPRP